MQYREAKDNPSHSSLSTGGRSKSIVFYLLPLCFVFFGGGLISCGNLAPLSMGGISLGGFRGNITKIGEIPNDQNAVATVYLQGQVSNRAPFVENGAYKLEDDTGTIWVLTNQAPPNIGDEVLLQGQVQFQSIPVGGQDLGEVFVQEQQQLQRRAGEPKSSSLPEEPNEQQTP